MILFLPSIRKNLYLYINGTVLGLLFFDEIMRDLKISLIICCIETWKHAFENEMKFIYDICMLIFSFFLLLTLFCQAPLFLFCFVFLVFSISKPVLSLSSSSFICIIYQFKSKRDFTYCLIIKTFDILGRFVCMILI